MLLQPVHLLHTYPATTEEDCVNYSISLSHVAEAGPKYTHYIAEAGLKLTI